MLFKVCRLKIILKQKFRVAIVYLSQNLSSNCLLRLHEPFEEKDDRPVVFCSFVWQLTRSKLRLSGRNPDVVNSTYNSVNIYLRCFENDT